VVSNPAGGLPPTTEPDRRLELAVIVPCYNVAATLAEQLDALVAETWTRTWGVVVVDNNSTDDTAAVAHRYSSRGVRVVRAVDGQGVAYARNAGVRSVDARSVVICDGDDVIQPGWVAALGDALLTHEFVAGATDRTLINEPDLATSRPMSSRTGTRAYEGTPFAPGGNCGMRRELFDRLGGFDESFQGLEDIEFSLRAHVLGVVPKSVPHAVLSYRMRTGARAIWRQGVFYGASQPLLIRRALELGLPAPSRWRGLKSWAWLVVHLPGLRHRAGRYQWLWVIACRLGVLRRSVQLRSLYV